MCQLLGLNCATPTDATFSFTGFCQRGGGTGRAVDGFGHSFAFGGGGFFGFKIKLGVKQGVNLGWGYTQDGLFFGDKSFVDHVNGNFNGGFGRAFAVAGLQHPEFTLFNGKLHILHFVVVQFQFFADVYKFLVDFWHFFI